MARIVPERLGSLIKQQRGNKSLKQIAAEMNVSAATLSRVEAGKQPDLQSFTKICAWLGVDPGEALGYKEHRETETAFKFNQATMLIHFRADKAMSQGNQMIEKIDELCYAWQLRLKLRDWGVSVKIASYEDIQGWGHIEWSLPEKVAEIKLMHPDSNSPNTICQYDIETTLVHELLHLHFAPFAAESETFEEQCQEQAINAIAKSLVELGRIS